ncbi:MAG: G/U mismatch-specific DNA glycosylase [Kofleriaceae bacterium]
MTARGSTSRRPSKDELEAARSKTVRDVIANRLDVLFCGINPGLYSAAVGHHFARPGNRFWPTLFSAGFTPRLFAPSEELLLLGHRLGITNLVARTTATADELSLEELRIGGAVLRRKVARYQPRFLAVVGLSAYRTAFEQPAAGPGLQALSIGETTIWVLPNPSGLNAHYQPAALAKLFRALRRAACE